MPAIAKESQSRGRHHESIGLMKNSDAIHIASTMATSRQTAPRYSNRSEEIGQLLTQGVSVKMAMIFPWLGQIRLGGFG